MFKDMKLALKTAESFHVPQYFASQAIQALEWARAAGYRERYHPVVIKVLEELTGVEVRTQQS